MSRSYKGVRAHTYRVYDIEGVMALYKVSRNTLTNWQKQGLRPVQENTHPLLFKGAELISFHKDRAERGTIKLRLGEFKCMRCKLPVLPDPSMVHVSETGGGKSLAQSCCPECAVQLFKLIGSAESAHFAGEALPNTTLDLAHEYAEDFPGGVVNQSVSKPEWNPKNELLIFAWQPWASKFSSSTASAHLSVIREFEIFTGFKDFERLLPEDVSAYRDNLKAIASSAAGQKSRSGSTLRHKASHLSSFLDWLGQHLPESNLKALAGYLALPKGMQTNAEREQLRDHMKIEEAKRILTLFADKTLLERRQRAIFALAFAAGLRENALVSLCLKHVDLAKGTIEHNGRELRAKNGKSFTVNFFARTEEFQQVFRAWVEELQGYGLGPSDALFPDHRKLEQIAALKARPFGAIPVMASAHAVDDAFKTASKFAGKTYTPHSVRHTLADLGDEVCRTAKHRKAWSLNMGHESEAITWGHYGKMRQDEKVEVFEEIGTLQSTDYTVQDLELIILFQNHRLTPGTEEFKRAQRLNRKYALKDEDVA